MIFIQDQSFVWFYAAVVMTAIGAFYLGAYLGAVPALTVAYLCLNGAWFWLLPTPFDSFQESRAAADSIGKLLFILGGVLFLSTKPRFKLYGSWLSVAFCLSCALSLVFDGGLLGNTSMTASMAVVSLPIAAATVPAKWRLLPVAITVSGVALSKSSIAAGLLACSFSVLAAPVILAVGYFVIGAEFLNSSDRLEMWGFFLKAWNVSEHWIFGRGIGSFSYNAFKMQNIFNVHTGNLWWNAHNDWLETFFSCGAIGFFLLAATYFISLKNLRGSYAKSFFLYGAMMVFNFPLHLATCAAFGAWLAILGLRRQDA